MKSAKHIGTGKIVSAEDASYKNFYGIFLCPECKEVLTLRKSYFRNGIEISPTFVHPSLDNRESCSQRQAWGLVENSFGNKPLPQGQLRSLLQKNIVDAICHYYLWWSGNPSNFNYIGTTDLHGLHITQAKTKITKFFQTEGEFTKQDAESIRKRERYLYELQFTAKQGIRHSIELTLVPRQFHQCMSVLYKQNNEHNELSDCLGQNTEPRLKNLNKFVKTSKIILEEPSNIKFITKNIDRIKNGSFSSLDRNNFLLVKHFNLVCEVAAFLFSGAQQDLVSKLAPYFITFPYQRRLKDTNSHWKEYEYCLKQVEEIFSGSKSKQFYYIFNSGDSSQYPEASKYVSYLLLNVVNILVRVDWISWFAKWQS